MPSNPAPLIHSGAKWAWLIRAAWVLLVFAILFRASLCQATDRFVSLTGAHQSPFANWSDAATNIQSAIDAAGDGDVIWVTNGIYSTGGKVMAGDLTNRVALDKAISVQSINGPGFTFIEGLRDYVSSGATGAVRCVWMTNGARLSGFTLRYGQGRSTGDVETLRSGGGVWCSSTTATLSNCVIRACSASWNAGGVYRGTLVNCAVVENVANTGGGVHSGVLRNSTIANNTARNTAAGGGTASSTHTNCIVWNNSSASGPNNFLSPTAFRNSCSSPTPSGAGNIASDPLLMLDGIHIASNSPCRGVGLSIAVATDIDGQSWNTPTAMGCDEWQPAPVAASPAIQVETWGRARLVSFPIGQSPFSYRWLKGGVELNESAALLGTMTTNLELRALSPADAGQYQLVVSNAIGMATSHVAQVTIHCVDANNATPAPPYSSWSSAANNIQDAVDAASYGDFILVTNGIYAQGGRAIAGGLTNRVALDKPVYLLSVAGPTATVIQGAWDYSTTNGPSAVRCAWMADGTAMFGFTLRGGATLSAGDAVTLRSGGGIWCNSTNARVFGCIIRGCSAGGGLGGAVYQGTLINSLIAANQNLPFAPAGAAAGAAYSSLINCTMTRNTAISGTIAGLIGATTNVIRNCVIWGNSTTQAAEASGATFSYTCTKPLPSGTGNISTDPKLSADDLRLSPGSPCVGTGSAALTLGVDIDGQTWATPPSMGCDEAHVEIAVDWPALIASGDGKIRLSVSPVGAAPQSFAWFKDGSLVTNDARISGAQTAELSITDFGPADLGGYFAVVTNGYGSFTGAVRQVRGHFVDAGNATPSPPFTNWTAAATNIQDAIDAAAVGDLVVVANGVYANGGRVVAGDLANRVVIDRAITVSSRFGPTAAIIEGQKDFGGVNGNGNAAIRAIWMDNWTSLCGFTIRNGATRTNGTSGTFQSGGGILAMSQTADARNCVITNNAAAAFGGGAYSCSLYSCLVVGNVATNGGGVAMAEVDRSVLYDNEAISWGGGAYACTVRNSVIRQNRNLRGFGGGGTYMGSAINCVIVENQGVGLGMGGYAYNSIIWGNSPSNYSTSVAFGHTCTTPATVVNVLSSNNIIADPQLLDNFHLAPTSPCRGAGGTAFLSGTDFDGDPWSNPPSIGAQEFSGGSSTGPLAVNLEAATTNALVNRSLTFAGRIEGRASRLEWSFGDGTVVTNIGYLGTHAWVAPGSYLVTLTVFNDDHPAGVAANLAVQIALPDAPLLTGEKLDNTIYRVWFFGQAGASNAVQFATNLNAPVFWHTFQNNVSTGSVMQVFDVTASNAMRFYRVRAQ